MAWQLAACTALPTVVPTSTPAPSETPAPTVTPSPTVVWFPPTATRTPYPTATAPAPTPEQRPGIGETLLEDDFSSAEIWLLTLSEAGNVVLGKNELTIAIARPKTYLYSVRTQTVFDDFYLEVTASPTLCRGMDEYGVLLRYASSGDFYRFAVGCDGQVRLDRLFRGQASSPQPRMLGAMVPVGAPSSSRLGIWAVGKEMRFFVNDQFQFSVTDPTVASGALGVFARSAGDTALTVSFSELVVYAVQP